MKKTTNKSEVRSKRRNDKENVRTGLGAAAIAEALIDNLHYMQAKLPQQATRNDWYMALAYTVRDRMLHGFIKTLEAIKLPPIPAESRQRWRRCIDTALESPDDIYPWDKAPLVAQTTYVVQPRSMVLLALALQAGRRRRFRKEVIP